MTFFVFQHVWVDDLLHANAVACSPIFLWSSQIQTDPWPAVVLPSGERVEVRRSYVECTNAVPTPGTECLDEKVEPFKSAKWPFTLWYSFASCHDRIIIEGLDNRSIVAPYFVSNEFVGSPACYRMNGKLPRDFASNPDIQCLVAWEQSKASIDRYDAMLQYPTPQKGVEYPRDCWLPGTFVSDHSETACVYSLSSDSHDTIHVFMLDSSPDPNNGGRIIRRARRHDGGLVVSDIIQFSQGCVIDSGFGTNVT